MPADTGSERHPRSRLVLRLSELTALKNPEIIGNAEWTLRVWVNGLERWQTQDHISIAEGQTASLGVDIPLTIFDESDEVGVDIEAVEKDWLNPDDRAVGGVVLYRVQGFSAVSGEVVDLKGSGAHLKLRLEVEVGAAYDV